MAGLNVLWISHFVPYPPKGGCFQRSYNLIKEASKQNNIYLVSFRHKDKKTHSLSEMEDAKYELEKICKKVVIVDLNTFSGYNKYLIAFKSIFTMNPLTVNLFKSKEMRDVLLKLTSGIRFDIAHYDTISLCEYFDQVGDIPKLLTHHGVESFMIKRRAINESNLLKKIYLLVEWYKLLQYEKRYCHKFFMNLMVSEDDKNMLKDISPSSRIEVVENGVDVNYFKPKDKHDNTNRLIFAGRLDQYSNADAIIHFCTNVWPLIEEKFPGMLFSIIGNNPPQKLLDIAGKHGGIEVLGYVDDVRPHFDEATIMVCPIRDGGGTRLKILDAMAMGMPIISTTIGCEGIDVSSGKDVMIADTPEEFVSGIEKIINDDMFRLNLSKCARITGENKYSWNIIGQKINQYYKESVGEERLRTSGQA